MQTPFFFLNNDSKLLDALRNGDEEALVELFRQNRRPVTSLVTRNQGSEDDAEDVLQEAVVVLWERVRSGSFDYKAKLSTFIYATAKNIWHRQLARHRRELPAADEALDVAADDATPLEELEENEKGPGCSESDGADRESMPRSLASLLLGRTIDGRNSDETRVCQCRYGEVEEIPVQEVSGAFNKKYAWSPHE